MLSADEAMLGGIPDREAPLPYIPKARCFKTTGVRWLGESPWVVFLFKSLQGEGLVLREKVGSRDMWCIILFSRYIMIYYVYIYLYIYIWYMYVFIYGIPPNRFMSFYSVFITPTSLMECSMSTLQIKKQKITPVNPTNHSGWLRAKIQPSVFGAPFFTDEDHPLYSFKLGTWSKTCWLVGVETFFGMGISYELPCFATKTHGNIKVFDHLKNHPKDLRGVNERGRTVYRKGQGCRLSYGGVGALPT